MPMAVSSAAHPDRVKMVYQKAVREITAAKGPGGMSMVDGLDRILDNLDKRDEKLSDGGKHATAIIYPGILLFITFQYNLVSVNFVCP